MKYQFLVPVGALVIFLIVFGSTGMSNNRTEESTYETALRFIGHKLLLSAGDSTSRVMPVKQLSANEFHIFFEKPVSLEPDSIYNIISKTIKSTSLPDDYHARVLKCGGKEIVYSFLISGIEKNIIVPCLKRTLPKDCYYLNINFSNTGNFSPQRNIFFAGCILAVMLLAYSIHVYFRRKGRSAIDSGNDSIAVNALHLGKYRFYFDQRYLEIDGDRIQLTDKESHLLNIFAATPNEIIDRDRLQKEVWENEGVIVTRSLDVFVSRLRKKLEKDQGLKIVNVHGKGYKLEIT